jgi:large subunit ribosomal protein L18
MASTLSLFDRRKARVRRSLKRAQGERARFAVFRSSKHIYAQIIDDAKGHTIASASSIDKELRANLNKGTDVAAAAVVGRLVAERALKAGVKDVVFDRGGYMFHGRIKALADAAREAGLNF